MFVYLFLLILTLLLYAHNKYSKNYALLLMFVMFLLCAFREYSVGIDTKVYVNFFEHNDNDFSSELLFDLTYTFVHFLGGSSRLWLIFVSFLLYVPYTISILRYSRVPVMSAFLFLTSTTLFFLDSMNGIRQWIAGGFILLAFLQNKNGDILKSIISISLAIGFHLSSIFSIPFFFFFFKKPSQKIVFLVLLTTLLVCMIIPHNDLTLFFEAYTNILGDGEGIMHDKLRVYSTAYSNLANESNWKYVIGYFLPISLLCFLSYVSPQKENSHLQYITKKHKKYARNDDFFFNCFFIATILTELCAVNIAYGHRIFYSIMTLQLIVLPEAYIKSSLLQRRGITCLLFVLSVWFCYYILSADNGVVPYHMF